MKRLTEKGNKIYYLQDVGTRLKKATIKLGKLEDIEEELGIDLITFIKVVKTDNIYTKKYGWFLNAGIDYEKDNNRWVLYLDRENKTPYLHCVLLTEYGKTWALEKEELEK